ncbi:MAG: hypothetical protein M3Q10_08180 [Chloroflexota bacterium]|nr:hypothetical protein [Chloroflexota bacterium]
MPAPGDHSRSWGAGNGRPRPATAPAYVTDRARPGAVLSTYVVFVPAGDRLVVDEIVDLTAAPATPLP